MCETIVLKKSESCLAKVHIFGATVTSWVCNGEEQLFLSTLSKMDGSKAIRGGIPVVFPNFGPWSHGPQHGFARSSLWKVSEKPAKLKDGNVVATFSLSDNEETRKQWNFKFDLQYKVTLSEKTLQTDLTIKNTGSSAFDFTTLLHTYIKVSDITQTTITGFKNCTYVDKVKGTENNKEDREVVTIDGNVDRVYKNAGNNAGHKVCLPTRHVKVEKTNMPDTVLWNPWKEKAAALSDFNDDGYLNMVCVEAGYVADRKVIQPNETFVCGQKLTVGH